MRTIVALAVAALASASAANATVLFSQNFEGLPQGIPAASIPGFSITGTVDIVNTPNQFGIVCAGGAGGCADIDGTPGPGALTSNPINFAAGRLLTIGFDLSGNQRGGASDVFNFTANFGSAIDFLGFTCTSGFIGCNSGDFTGQTSLGAYAETIAPNRPFLGYSVSFTPTTAGSLQLVFSSPSANNVGPILDNVLVSQVPEPASWAMLIGGFGIIGATLRRRRERSQLA